MCKVIEDMILEERREIAKRMIFSKKLSTEEVAEYTNLTIAEVEALAAQHSE